MLANSDLQERKQTTITCLRIKNSLQGFSILVKTIRPYLVKDQSNRYNREPTEGFGPPTC